MDTHQTLTNVKQITELCRYCLMCRHTCPITHVTHTEATSPHGWGILVASVERGVTTWTAENVNVLYQCSDCGSCQAHCVTDQPLPLAINASRADVVAQQKAPAAVYDIRQKLQQWGNPYAETAPETVSAQGENALIVGAAGKYLQPQTVDAAVKLLAAAGVRVVPIAVGRESPYLPNTLGLLDEARALGQATLDEVKAVGAGRVFVLSPGDIYTYHGLFHFLGIPWPRHIEIVEVTTFLADQLAAGRLSLKPVELSDYAYFDPDHTVRVPDRWEAPRQLLAAVCQTPPIELFWRKERAMTSGANSGLVFTQPDLAAKLAQTRLAEAAGQNVKTLITDDPHVLHHLKNQPHTGITIRGLLELLAEHL